MGLFLGNAVLALKILRKIQAPGCGAPRNLLPEKQSPPLLAREILAFTENANLRITTMTAADLARLISLAAICGRLC